jgi:hypothetical protein
VYAACGTKAGAYLEQRQPGAIFAPLSSKVLIIDDEPDIQEVATRARLQVSPMDRASRSPSASQAAAYSYLAWLAASWASVSRLRIPAHL